MSPSTSTRSGSSVPTFEALGVRPLINCRGTYTIISGSRVLPQVIEAMAQASDHYVHMDELMEAVGRRLAELTGAEWGYIAAGCAAIMAQVTAACVAGADPERMARLPDVSGMPDEVIMQRAHRNEYDWAIRMTGARILQIETEAELRAALSQRTAMVAINADADDSTIPIERMLAIARERGIPCLVDAAAQRPDVPNRYLAMRADVVAYSGGKCLRGPQSTGFALGRKDILWAAFLNGAPHHALGRPMKSGKEEIMGLLAAIEAWIVGRDHQAEWRMWERYLEHIRRAVCDLPSLQTRIRQPGLPNHAPLLLVTWDAAQLGIAPQQAHQALWSGEPRIALHLLVDGLGIMPYMMEEGDDDVVAQRLREVLAGGGLAMGDTTPAPPVDVLGDWLVELRYTLGNAQHALSLDQNGERLTGKYRSQYAESSVEGAVSGCRVSFRTVLGHEANRTVYAFEGTVAGDSMAGQVDLGEYGQARWTARRVEP